MRAQWRTCKGGVASQGLPAACCHPPQSHWAAAVLAATHQDLWLCCGVVLCRRQNLRASPLWHARTRTQRTRAHASSSELHCHTEAAMAVLVEGGQQQLQPPAHSSGHPPSIRLCVRGLPPGTTPAELAQRFVSFGDVTACEFVAAKRPEAAAQSPPPPVLLAPPWPDTTPLPDCRCAYVELAARDESALARCLSLVRTAACSVQRAACCAHGEPCAAPWPTTAGPHTRCGSAGSRKHTRRCRTRRRSTTTASGGGTC